MFRISSPLNERLFNLRIRLEEKKSNLALWLYISGLERGNVNENVRADAIRALGLGDESGLDSAVEKSAIVLGGLRSHLSASSILYKELVESAIGETEKIAELSRQGQSQQTVLLLQQLGSRLERDLFPELEEIQALLFQRLFPAVGSELAVLDSSVSFVLYQSAAVLEELGAIRSSFAALPPLALATSDLTNQASANFPTSLSSGRFAPWTVFSVPASLCAVPWELLRACKEIGFAAIATLNLESDSALHVQRLLGSLRISLTARSIFQSCWRDLLTETIAVLLAGPGYARAVIQSEMFPSLGARSQITPAYIRWAAVAVTLKKLGFVSDAEEIEARVRTTVGSAEFVAAQNQSPELLECLALIEPLVSLWLDQPIARFSGYRIDEVLPIYDEVEHRAALQGAQSILSRAQVHLPVESMNGNGHGDLEEVASAPKTRRGPRSAPSEQSFSPLTAMCAARLAYERANSAHEYPRNLGVECKNFFNETLHSYSKSSICKKTQREFSADEVRQLLRKRTAPVASPVMSFTRAA